MTACSTGASEPGPTVANQGPSEDPGPRVRLIGLGNDIMSDDAVGLRLARLLRVRFAEERLDVEVVESEEGGLSLLDLVAGADVAFLLDAMFTRKYPVGTLLEVDAGEARATSAASAHFLSIGETMALGRMLEMDIPRSIRILAIEVGDPYTVGAELTPSILAALPGLAESILERVRTTITI